MMTIQQLTRHLTEKAHFNSLQEYKDFAMAFLDFADQGLQAKIVCQNEVNYQFFQYREDCGYNISRPINSDLFATTETFCGLVKSFDKAIVEIATKKTPAKSLRHAFNSVVYTLQQSIGVALDALPASSANQAKKINGGLFERLIRLLMQEVNVDCTSGDLSIPVKDDSGKSIMGMKYQHDLIARYNGKVVFLGSVKTSSKERLSKIFVDKLLHDRLTGTDTPYIAVFLNDVQRASSRTLGRQNVGTTFLPGHFKAYTLKLTPLSGVYYCDLRPNMKTDPFLSEHIRGIDGLFFDEVKKYCK